MSFLKVLYGSRARGDSDGLSDTDVLVVADRGQGDYSWDELRRMHAYGSLFLKHLALEGVVVDGDPAGLQQWNEMRHVVPPYRRVRQDLRAFRDVLGDVGEALQTQETELVFEAGVLARTVRHVAILACYLRSEPNFSRYGAVSRAAELYGLRPVSGLSFERLYAAVITPCDFDGDTDAVADWVAFGSELVAGMELEARSNG